MRKDRAEKRPDPAFGRWTHQPSLVITVRKDKDNCDLKVFKFLVGDVFVMNRDKLFRGIFLIQREKRANEVTVT